MPARTNAQQLELKDIFRRGAGDPNRKSSFRKNIFRRLLNLAKEPHFDDFCKRLVTERVKDFFVDFPEFQDEAINIIYDICEDQDQEIRIAGYSSITTVSRSDTGWLARNADVLVQLLQSDDPREVTVVKRALQEHIDIDPRSTLQVLCDQCVFNAAELADDEDRMLRARLRGLVIQFLAEKYRVCIARVVKKIEVEEVLLKGLVNAIPTASASDIQIVVTDILLNLPSVSDGPSEKGDAILMTLLDAIRATLEVEQPDVDKLYSLLQQARRLTSPVVQPMPIGLPGHRALAPPTNSAADPLRLLNFLDDDALMQCMPHEAGLQVVEVALSAYDAALRHKNKLAGAPYMIKAAPVLVGLLTRYISATRDSGALRLCLGFSNLLIDVMDPMIPDRRSPPPSFAAAVKALMSELSSASSWSKADDIHGRNTIINENARIRDQALSYEANQVIQLLRKLLQAIEYRSTDTLRSRARGQGDQINWANRIPSSPLSNTRTGPSGRQEDAFQRTASVRSDNMDVDSGGREGVYEDAAMQKHKRLRKENAIITQPGGAPSLLSRLGPSVMAEKTEGEAKTQPDLAAGVTRANVRGTGDLRSRTMLRPVNLRGPPPHARSASHDRSESASVGVGDSIRMKPHTSQLSTNGEAGNFADSDGKHQLIRKEPCQDFSMEVAESTEISILGASQHSGGEIRIKGAAERHTEKDNSSGGLGGDRLSLLARLSTRGIERDDRGGGRKRKRNRF